MPATPAPSASPGAAQSTPTTEASDDARKRRHGPATHAGDGISKVLKSSVNAVKKPGNNWLVSAK
jgi:hypothetical protein